MIPQILTCHSLDGNSTYHDTHASGLKGAEVRIDCTITDGPRCPAHVITYAEAKLKLQSTCERAEAVAQIWQRLDQLDNDQDMRETWTAAIIGHSNFQLWRPDWVQAHPYVLIFTELRLRRVSDDVQALGYVSPYLPRSLIANEVMCPSAKVFQNSSTHDSAKMLRGKVMVFAGKLSDGHQAIAKLPARDEYLQREVENLEKIADWPELTDSVVHLRAIGRPESLDRKMLILQPVGCLIPYNIGIDALLSLMKHCSATCCKGLLAW